MHTTYSIIDLLQLFFVYQLAYLDRVVHIRRWVGRAWPTIKGWTTETLKQREEAERDQFGTGRLENRVDKEKYLVEEKARRLEDVNRGGGAGEAVQDPAWIELSV